MLSIFAVHSNGSVKFTQYNVLEAPFMGTNEQIETKLRNLGYVSIVISRY